MSVEFKANIRYNTVVSRWTLQKKQTNKDNQHLRIIVNN